MAYLQPADYPNYGLPIGTSMDWITSATSLINSFCRRPDLNIVQYTERLRVTSGARAVRLSYLPLAAQGEEPSPLVSLQVRYAAARRGEVSESGLADIVMAFSVPGQWSFLDVNAIDFD